ncbi:MAG TPA: TIGR04551 family protein [Myxococcaceae bacterium]
MKVTALAALLVSATALAQTQTPAQTPPPGAPVAEPKFRSDADIQREIDARVEAAKKELREEMRAQAATVAATSASSTWETEAAVHRKLDLLELHGYFRVRPELLHKLDLDQPPDASNFWLFPRPDGQFLATGLSGGHSIAGTNMRFRLDPTLNISEEVRIKAQIDALDNLVWGSTPQYAYIRQDRVDIGLLGASQVPPIPGVNSSQSNLAVKRVWGEVATPIGLLKFGRMGDQYGLGIVHNDGNCLDCDYGVTVDRFQFVAEPLPGFFIVPTIDFDLEGLVSGKTGTQGQPYDVTNSDDAHTFGIILARKDTDQKARTRIESGGTIVNYGLFFQYRSQRYEYNQQGTSTSFTPQDPYQLPNPSLSRIPRNAYLFIPDIWFKLERKAFKIELEVAAYLGKAQGCLPFDNGTSTNCDFSQELTIAQYGGALQTEWRLLDGALKIGLEVGAASGDSAPGFGNKPNRQSNQTRPSSTTSGAQFGDYEGAQYGQRPCNPTPGQQALLCQDRDIRNFRFNQDYRIDLILWREIIGGITDALYVKPGVSYAFNDSISVFGNFIYSKALKPTSTPSGTSTQLGLEIDAGVRFQTDDGFYAQLAYGILFPFDGLQYNYPSIYVGAPISPSIAQAIRAQLGIRF